MCVCVCVCVCVRGCVHIEGGVHMCKWGCVHIGGGVQMCKECIEWLLPEFSASNESVLQVGNCST